ncbi:MAG: glucosaminidase domain-containing protein [Gammaproteobacteria bacterium]
MKATRLQRWLPSLVVGAGPVLIAAAIILPIALSANAGSADWPVHLLPLHARNASQLAATFKNYRYTWPPADAVPALGLRRLPTGLQALDPDLKKSLFLRAVLPLVLAANNRIRRQRAYVIHALEQAKPGSWQGRLLAIAAAYDVHAPLTQAAARADLLRRCNVVPVALVLAQAAKESGWGTSRFALQGNNLFGVHTWDPSLGLKAARSKQHHVLILAYTDLRASVRDYIHNLNVGHAYVAFRKLRAWQKKHDKLNVFALVSKLGSYSKLGERYTRQLQQVIRDNHLSHLHPLNLSVNSLGR